jgi:hypothetical protein
VLAAAGQVIDRSKAVQESKTLMEEFSIQRFFIRMIFLSGHGVFAEKIYYITCKNSLAGIYYKNC